MSTTYIPLNPSSQASPPVAADSLLALPDCGALWILIKAALGSWSEAALQAGTGWGPTQVDTRVAAELAKANVRSESPLANAAALRHDSDVGEHSGATDTHHRETFFHPMGAQHA